MQRRTRIRAAGPQIDPAAELRESEARYRALFEASPLPVLLWDLETSRIMDVNEAALASYGYTRDELLERSIQDLRLPALVARLPEAPVSDTDFGLTTHLRKNGTPMYVEVGTRTLTLHGRQVCMQMAHDVTERIRAQEEVRFRATHDALTGMLNRPSFLEEATQALAQAQAAGIELAFAFMDLDGFKLVNDTHGHLVGDALLRIVAKRLRATVRDTDTIARMGGDEFIILFHDAQAGVERVAAEVVRRLAEPYALEHRTIRISASVGISRSPRDGTGLIELLRSADAALYRAKEHGRNRYVFA